MKEKVTKEKEMWKALYNNYEELASQILVDALGFFPKEQRQEKVGAVIEFLNQIGEPLSGETFKESVKNDLASFERINNEAQIAYRTLQWVEDEIKKEDE